MFLNPWPADQLRTGLRKWVVSPGVRVSQDIHIRRQQGEGVSGRRSLGGSWSGRRHDAGHWKESAGSCGSVAWHIPVSGVVRSWVQIVSCLYLSVRKLGSGFSRSKGGLGRRC